MKGKGLYTAAPDLKPCTRGPQLGTITVFCKDLSRHGPTDREHHDSG